MEETDLSIGQILAALWREKFVISAAALFGLMAGVYYVFFVAEARYTAVSKLVMEVQSQQIVNIESVLSGGSNEESAINTELEIIKSRRQIEELITQMRLIEDPEFNHTLRPAAKISLSAGIALIKAYMGDTPPEITSEDILYMTTRNVSDAVRVTALRKTHILDIRVTTGDPEKSSEMANRLSQIYMDDQVAVKFAATEYAVNWLSERVRELEQELFDKEDQIKALKSETDLIDLQNLELLRIRAKDLRGRLSEAQSNLDTSRRRLALGESALSGSRDATAKFFSDPLLIRLLPDTTSGDSLAQGRFDTRAAKLLAADRLAFERLDSQVLALQSSFDDLSQDIRSQGKDLERLQQLEREADVTRVLYETFLTRLKETTVQIGLLQADSRILSEAIPGYKVAPRKLVLLAAFLMLGVGLGVAWALLRQFRQRGFSTIQELEDATGLTALGQVPQMHLKRREQLLDYLEKNHFSAAVDAIRNLRTSFMSLNFDSPPQVILSTSSVPGEGKTTQSIALAHNLVKLNKRVLIIDGDIRRRTLREYFDGAGRKNLSEVVAQSATLDEAIFHHPGSGIDVLLEQNPSSKLDDLFHSSAFKALLDQLRSQYDFIIIDSPPVLLVPDARVIAQFTDAVLYSVKWGSTPQRVVQDGLRQFAISGLKVDGLVLSLVNTTKMQRYGYGYGAYQGGYNGSYYSET